MFGMKYRRNGGEHSLEITTATGVQRWDLSELNRVQLAGVKEMVVDHWCRTHGYPPMYAEA